MLEMLKAILGSRESMRLAVFETAGGMGLLRLLLALMMSLPLVLQSRHNIQEMLPADPHWADQLPDLLIRGGKLVTDPVLEESFLLHAGNGRVLVVITPELDLPAEAHDAELVLERTRYRTRDADGSWTWNSYAGLELELERNRAKSIVDSLPVTLSVMVVFPVSLVLLWLMAWILASLLGSMAQSFASRAGLSLEKDMSRRMASLAQLPAALLLSLVIFIGVRISWMPLWYLLLCLPGMWNLTRGTLSLLAEDAGLPAD